MSGRYQVIVTNIRDCKDGEYIGRPSVLGNPYPMSTPASREHVCDQYEIWFRNKIHANDRLVMHELMRLHRVGKAKGILKITCHCKSERRPHIRCHGDTVKNFLDGNYDFLEELIG